HHAGLPIEEPTVLGSSPDSPLGGAGFEPSVPPGGSDRALGRRDSNRRFPVAKQPVSVAERGIAGVVGRGQSSGNETAVRSGSSPAIPSRSAKESNQDQAGPGQRMQRAPSALPTGLAQTLDQVGMVFRPKPRHALADI